MTRCSNQKSKATLRIYALYVVATFLMALLVYVTLIYADVMTDGEYALYVSSGF